MTYLNGKHLSLLFLSVCIIACTTQEKQPEPDLFSLQQLAGKHTADCNAEADLSRPQYIIGYGSLMQAESRQRTAPNAGDAIAIEITGFRRGWFSKGGDIGFSTTFLGAIADANHSFNAVMFAVDRADMAAIDKREASYCRSEVPASHIQALQSGTSLPQGQYWIYLNSHTSIAFPSADKPLVASYVDIFLSGCLEQEEQQLLTGFALRCIKSTTDWSPFWVNDRIYPRRPFIHQPRAAQIDRLLDTALPELFRQIVLE